MGYSAKLAKDAGVDIIEIGFGSKTVKVEVMGIADTTKKDEAAELFRYI